MLVCSCFPTSETEYLEALRAARDRPARCRAGQGCGSCVALLERLKREQKARATRKTDPERTRRLQVR